MHIYTLIIQEDQFMNTLEQSHLSFIIHVVGIHNQNRQIFLIPRVF